MTKKRPELAGEFSQPIVRPDPLLMALLMYGQSDKRRRLIKSTAITWPLAEQLARIQLIAKAYGIEDNDPRYWMKLSVFLCNEFIEETRIHDSKPKGPGAPKKNSTELWSAVRDLKGPGITTSEVCKRLSEAEGPWKGKAWKAIEARFYEVDKRMGELTDRPATPFMEHMQSICNGELDSFDDLGFVDELERKHHGNSQN